MNLSSSLSVIDIFIYMDGFNDVVFIKSVHDKLVDYEC